MIKRALALAAAFVGVLVATGCGGPAWSDGPRYASVKPPAGYGVVYVYRERKAASSLAPMAVRVEDRWVDVLNASYAVFFLRTGKHRLYTTCAPEYVSLVRWGGLTPAFSLGWLDLSKTEKEGQFVAVDLDTTPDKPLYVRVECGHIDPSAAALVAEQDATPAIAELSLAPGGRGRVAWEDPTP